MGDARRLFDWRNDPLTRAMSRDSSEVEWEGHRAWLERTLNGTARSLFVIESDGVPAATSRLDFGEETEFSFTIAPEYRGKGLSVAMAALALAQASDCVADIRADNIACQRVMRSAGMVLIADGEMQRWHFRGAERQAA